jgi:hypothetical protein
VFVPKFVALESSNLEEKVRLVKAAGVSFPAGNWFSF